MKVYFLKQKALDALEKDIADNLDKYQGTEQWAENYFIGKDMPNYYFDTEIEVPDYQLIIGGPETDFENAKIIYEAYSKNINPVQASDLRLWAYLAHVQHWDYMNTRWKIDAPDEEDDVDDEDQGEEKKTSTNKILDRIGFRYFFKASKGKAFVRQGISRLYWSAYLSYDDENDNPYEFTEYFFSKQDIFSSVTERSYARNKILILAALKVMKGHPELSRDQIRLFLLKLNQAGAITVLDFLDKEQASQLCSDIMSEILNEKAIVEGSSIKICDNITGKPYASDLVIKNGIPTLFGKKISTKPSKLIGKRVGFTISISGRKYVVKEID